MFELCDLQLRSLCARTLGCLAQVFPQWPRARGRLVPIMMSVFWTDIARSHYDHISQRRIKYVTLKTDNVMGPSRNIVSLLIV